MQFIGMTRRIIRHFIFYAECRLPRYHFMNYVSTSILRLAGMKIGARTRIVGAIDIEMSVSDETISCICIGNRCFINSGVRMSTRNTSITIGDDVLIGPRVSIETSSHSLDFDPLKGRGTTNEAIDIHDRVWIAAGATLLPGVTVGVGAVVAAGAVVTRDVAAYTLVGGVPARHIRDLRRP